jgi:hypothetical protein
LVCTGVTLFDVTAQGSGAALLDCAHHPQLPAAEGIRVLLAVDGSGLAEDIRHFEPWRGHHRAQK